MNWSHAAVLIGALILGYWLGGKYPGWLAKTGIPGA